MVTLQANSPSIGVRKPAIPGPMRYCGCMSSNRVKLTFCVKRDLYVPAGITRHIREGRWMGHSGEGIEGSGP